MASSAGGQAGEDLGRGFRLEALEVDPAAGRVMGPGGREELDPKVMQVFVLLAGRAGQVVSREELHERIWPGAVVTDDALTRCIHELRRQLSQAGADERYRAMIETLPKRGYRLNGAVTPLSPRAGSRPAGTNWKPYAGIAAAAVAAVALWYGIAKESRVPARDAAGEIAIAVLPFADMSAAQDQEHFSDGVSEEILNRLASNRSLRVIARTSSFAFRGQVADIPEIAARLQVTHVLEGSVRKAGNRVRITTRLVDAASNAQLWTETYDRELGDLFATQDEIAAEVATALRVTLAGTARRSPVPTNQQAYDAFLRGEFFYNRRAPGDVGLAEKYYKDALAIEPGYARAWAALAGTYSLLAYEGAIPRAEALEMQGSAARKAIELDPTLAAAHARLSQYHWDIGDPKTGYEIWDKAKALDPDDLLVLNFAAGVAMRAGEIDEAVRNQRRLVTRDPLSAGPRANLGSYLQAQGRLEEALVEFERALELNPKLGSGVDLAIARLLILLKRFKEAAGTVGRLPEGELRDHGLALLAHAEGRREDADAALARLVAESSITPDIRLAEVHAFRGSREAAFKALQGLQDAIDWFEPRFTSQIWSWQVEMRVSPFLLPLHADPRWEAMMVEPGLT